MTHSSYSLTIPDHRRSWNLEQDITAAMTAVALAQGERQDLQLAAFEQAMISIRQGLDLLKTIAIPNEEIEQ